MSVPAAVHGGLLLVDKPAGVTSFAVVDHVRRELVRAHPELAPRRRRGGGPRPPRYKCGHAGTLDPLATGLLLASLRLQGLATAMVKAIAAEHGERYRLISGASLYPAAGTLMDWAYGIRGVASFVIELRPRGGTGFVLPPKQIAPTCDEGLAAVLALHERRRAGDEASASSRL